MIKTAICDDDKETRAYLASLIGAQPYACEIREYASAGAYLLARRDCDLLFLDVKLDNADDSQNGMSLARKIRAQDLAVQPVIVFVTGYEQYALEAFDVGAFHYLLKPINEDKFAGVFASAAAQINQRLKKAALTCQAANTSRIVPLDNIYYIESSNHKVVLHLQDGEFAYYAKIKDLEQELSGQFFRIHKGYLLNLSYVSGYSKTEVTLTNGEKLLLSKYKYHDFVKAYLHFLRRGAGL